MDIRGGQIGSALSSMASPVVNVQEPVKRINNGLEMIIGAVEMLEQNTKAICQKLEPMSLPTPPPPTESETKNPIASPMAESLIMLAKRIRACNSSLSSRMDILDF